ncbi:MAG: C-GCAxxG-C-C family protein [Oscillospiraceae bacterium]
MSAHQDKAEALFLQGYNCCQSVLGAFAEDLGLPFETALKLASGFGGGVGRQRGLCGAVSGICMAYGLAKGYSSFDAGEEKQATYLGIQQLCAEFKSQNGSVICAQLLDEEENGVFSPPEKRTQQYYATRPCKDLVRSAALILDNVL